MKSINSYLILFLTVLLCLPQYSKAQFTNVGPSPGDVYKEYSINLPRNNKSWRVTDPNSTFVGDPNNSPSTFLPNPVHSFNIDDYSSVERVEIIMDVWGGHVGTTGKKIKFNNNSWINVSELNTTPSAGQCFTQQVTYVIDVPVSHLRSGTNTIQGTSGNQTCFSFNWGQWGWYGAIVRVYYSSNKGQTTGQIVSHSSGGSFTDNPVIRVNPNGGVSRIDVLAKYDGYDVDGDGYYYEWVEDYHRRSWGDDIGINSHVGTTTSSPYSVTWNTEWVPDQSNGAVSFVARIRNNNGYWYVTNEVRNLTLQRNNHSVRIYKAQNVPRNFWVRNGQTKSSNVNIPSLSNATQARLHVRTWNGNEHDANFYTRVNSQTIPDYGMDHFYSYDNLNVPLNALKTGTNTITFHSSTTHHGIEILWPGPAVIVKYGSAPPPTGTAPTITQQPSNQNKTAGETATFSVAATGSTPFTYQWRRNGQNISGANQANYTTPSLTLNNNGDVYSCVVSNSYGSEISNNATLAVSGASGSSPSITQQPGNVTIPAGQTATFSIQATGSPTLSYQWRRNGQNISGANQASYTTPSLTINNDGDVYSCVVSNSYGNVTSNGATLSVTSSGGGGNTTKIEVENNYTVISDVGDIRSIGARSSSINSNNQAVLIADTGDKIGVNFNIPESGNYKIKVWLRSGGATHSTSYFLPQYTYIFNLTGLGVVDFEGNESSVMGPYDAYGGSYWGFMEADVYLTAGNKTLGIEAKYVWQAVDYIEIVGGSTSPGTPPTITQQPSNVTADLGETATFSVSATGSTPLVYQWRKNGTNIQGANQRTYTTSPLSGSDDGNNYSCIVSNDFGSAISNLATLSVNSGSSGGDGGTTTKIEAEDNYSVIADVGSIQSIQVKGFSINSNGQAVSIPDTGDKIGINFNIPSAGNYTIKVWVRSGGATHSTSYFLPQYTYIYTLTGLGTVDFQGDESSVMGPYNAWGGSYWGYMEADVNFPSGGNKTLTIESKYVWQAVDFIEVIGEGGTNPDPDPDPEPEPTDDLVLDLPFSGNAQDVSGNNNNGQVNGAQLTSDKQGAGNSAYVFDGSGDYILVPHSSELNVDYITVAAWINLDTYKDDQRIITKETGSNSPWSSYTLLMSGSGERYLQFRIGINGVRRIVTSNSQIPLNQWVHVAATFDGSTIRLFINGQLNRTASYSGVIQDTSNPVYIGDSQFWSRGLDGKIDDVKIYDIALPNSSIASLYSNGTARIANQLDDRNDFWEFNDSPTLAFPNPVNESKRVSIQLNRSYNDQQVNISLMTLHGALLYEKRVTGFDIQNELELDLSNVLEKQGVYLLRIAGEEKSEILKLVYN